MPCKSTKELEDCSDTNIVSSTSAGIQLKKNENDLSEMVAIRSTESESWGISRAFHYKNERFSACKNW